MAVTERKRGKERKKEVGLWMKTFLGPKGHRRRGDSNLSDLGSLLFFLLSSFLLLLTVSRAQLFESRSAMKTRVKFSLFRRHAAISLSILYCLPYKSGLSELIRYLFHGHIKLLFPLQFIAILFAEITRICIFDLLHEKSFYFLRSLVHFLFYIYLWYILHNFICNKHNFYIVIINCNLYTFANEKIHACHILFIHQLRWHFMTRGFKSRVTLRGDIEGFNFAKKEVWRRLHGRSEISRFFRF